MRRCRLEKFPSWLSWSCSQPWSSWHISSLRRMTWALVLRFQAQWGLLAVTCSVASHDKQMIHGLLSVSSWLAFLPSLFMSLTDSLRTRVSKVCESRGSGPQRRSSKWKGISSFQTQMYFMCILTLCITQHRKCFFSCGLCAVIVRNTCFTSESEQERWLIWIVALYPSLLYHLPAAHLGLHWLHWPQKMDPHKWKRQMRLFPPAGSTSL